jgi:hypothetical protein
VFTIDRKRGVKCGGTVEVEAKLLSDKLAYVT